MVTLTRTFWLLIHRELSNYDHPEQSGEGPDGPTSATFTVTTRLKVEPGDVPIPSSVVC